MSGHSKWANIKARKGAQDARRGKTFTKIAKEIIVAARIGGGDPDGNPRLRAAILAGRAINMPKDNIERAIQRGTGEQGGDTLEEVLYEGYGTSGVAILVEANTDNRNRTTGEIRHLFGKYGGNLGVPGSAARAFLRQGQIGVPADTITEEELYEAAIEAGADDIQREEGDFLVFTKPEELHSVSDALQKAGVQVTSVQPVYTPTLTVTISGDGARGLLKLMEALEDNDDVAHVWANFDMDETEMEAFGD